MASRDPEIEEYLSEIGKFPLLTQSEEVSLAHRIAAGDEEARQEMIRANLRLVVSIASKFAERGMSLVDLVEEGNLGLLKAVTRFNPEEGCKFSTYATWWIKQSIRRGLLNKVKPVRIPAYMFEKISVWRKTASQMAQRLGREPSAQEVAAQLNMPAPQFVLMQKALSAVAPMGRGSDGDKGVSFEDLLTSAPGHDDSHDADEYDREALRNAMDIGLTERERHVIEFRYGLKTGKDGKVLTLEEVGGSLGLTRERIRQIECHALRKLQIFIQERREKDEANRLERTKKERGRKKR